MKLALASSDFEENTITFLVPEAVMLDMGFYPCELEVGVEELMKHPPKKAEPAPAAPSEEANIRVHIDMLLDDEMREHACADKSHDLHFQIFRVLGGYRQALDELKALRSQLARKDEEAELYRRQYDELSAWWRGERPDEEYVGKGHPLEERHARERAALRESDGRKGE